MEIDIEILKPVNPSGIAFIKVVYAGIGAKDNSIIEKYKKTLSKMLVRLSYKLEEEIGQGKAITGTITLEVDENGKPKKIYTKSIEVWDITKKLDKKIEVYNRYE